GHPNAFFQPRFVNPQELPRFDLAGTQALGRDRHHAHGLPIVISAVGVTTTIGRTLRSPLASSPSAQTRPPSCGRQAAGLTTPVPPLARRGRRRRTTIGAAGGAFAPGPNRSAPPISRPPGVPGFRGPIPGAPEG